MQVIAVVTSFLSLCFAFVMWREAAEQDKLKKQDKQLQKDVIEKDGAIEQCEMIERAEVVERREVQEKVEMLEKEENLQDYMLKNKIVIEKEDVSSQNAEDAEHEVWNWKDMVVDMVWNILSIGPRVISLALFASYQIYWFWGLIGLQVTGAMLILLPIACNGPVKFCEMTVCISTGLFTGLGTVFNMFVLLPVPFFCYLLYWVLMFIENTVMISLWYQWSSDLGLWYHDAALSFVIVGYVLSLVTKCIHCSFYNKKKESIFEWDF